jgi:hypothetical protein
MSYLARLKAKIAEKPLQREPPKVASVSFGSSQGSPLCADDGKIEVSAGLFVGGVPQAGLGEIKGIVAPCSPKNAYPKYRQN